MSALTGMARALACGLACVVVLLQSGDVLTYWPRGNSWPATAIPVWMVLRLGGAGSSWHRAAVNALTVWNAAGSRFHFSALIADSPPVVSCSNPDRRNVMVWRDKFCGEAWSGGTLAITKWWGSPNIIDSDVVFNSNSQWAWYRGNLRLPSIDFERVAIHELGHVLGLDHPDDHGQSVHAIMNAGVSNIHTITADDIDGVVAIYGGTARPPPTTSRCFLADLGTVAAEGATVLLRGTLDADCVSPNYSGELARYYRFRIVRAADVTIDMTSSNINSWLTLRRGANIRGAELTSNDDGGAGRNARITRRLQAGTYTIEATSAAPRDTGAFRLRLNVVPVEAQPPTQPGRTRPPTLDVTCHGYDEGPTRAYNCIPVPSQQRLMRTFVPAVGSACDQGSIAEFPAGRIVFQIRCRDGAAGRSAAWSHAGRGRASFVKPADTTRVWLRTSFLGSSAHLSVWCRAPQAYLVVNELLGASWGNDGTNGIYGMDGCSAVEVDAGAEDVQWWFTPEPSATALTPPRSWEGVSGAGRALGADALRDLAAAGELERDWGGAGLRRMNPGEVSYTPDDYADALEEPYLRNAVRTSPLTLDLTCHGYNEGAARGTRAYNCIPVPSQQRYMRTFVPPVGSACDRGRIAEFPAGRIVFQIRCRDGVRAQSAAWSHAGRGPASFVKSADTPRVWVRAAFSGSSAHFSVWCRSPREQLVVNELLGRAWGNDGTNGIYGMAGCGEVEVDTGSAEDVGWSFTQELDATALWPPRSWEQAIGADGALSPPDALEDLDAAVELERLWPRP